MKQFYENILYFTGQYEAQIVSINLPFTKQVLNLVFINNFNKRNLKFCVCIRVTLPAKKVTIIWKKATLLWGTVHIPTPNNTEVLENLTSKRQVKKSEQRKSSKHKG